MTAQDLMDTAHRLVGGGKGLLAMDESTHICMLTFSFARAVQRPALEVWRGREAGISPSGRHRSVSWATIWRTLTFG